MLETRHGIEIAPCRAVVGSDVVAPRDLIDEQHQEEILEWPVLLLARTFEGGDEL